MREELDALAQTYMRTAREWGGTLSVRIVIAAAQGITEKYNQSMVVEFGG